MAREGTAATTHPAPMRVCVARHWIDAAGRDVFSDVGQLTFEGDRVMFTGRVATVISVLALFVALGGTAAAVTAIPRDSVGAPQIRKDAVRSPEIAKDAVRSPEIAKDAVRSAEIAEDAVRGPEIAENAVGTPELRDGAIRLDDISTAARNALKGAQGPAGPAGVAEARVARGTADVAQCTDQDLTNCPDLLTRTVGAGNWVIQAKLDISDFKSDTLEHCGLEVGSTALDHADFTLEVNGGNADIAAISLSGVVTNASNPTTVALRCSEQPGHDLFAAHMVITALKVTTVTGS
jgi:hypothetical protein